ncbi:MAG: OmpA family protein, partial [Desulfobacteraceae bacterium]|nr:OmpA family protein [Desulfobacteraceae bacterium]
KLSERRAASVKNLLVSRGVQDFRINTIGYGKSRPLATNATPEGRQMNRRVEIRINPNTQG